MIPRRLRRPQPPAVVLTATYPLDPTTARHTLVALRRHGIRAVIIDGLTQDDRPTAWDLTQPEPGTPERWNGLTQPTPIPLSPDCAAAKHQACNGDSFADDHLTPCPCPCHWQTTP